MIPFVKKKVTLTLQQMVDIQNRTNEMRLENKQLQLALQEAHTHIEVLKREIDSVKKDSL